MLLFCSYVTMQKRTLEGYVKRPKRPPKDMYKIETAKIAVIDDLSEFDAFKKDLLPKIRKMMKEGKKAKEIIELTQSMAAARLATIAVTDADSKTALSAALAILDRTMGKPTEKREVTHAMANLKDQELDAVVLTALNDAAAEGVLDGAAEVDDDESQEG